MTFVEAMNKTPSIKKEFKVGLRALAKSDRRLVSCKGPRLHGSVDIDSALRTLFPHAARWDYLVGVGRPRQRDAAIWIEVHSASSSHVDEVISKLRWLEQWLGSSAQELKRLPRS